MKSERTTSLHVTARRLKWWSLTMLVALLTSVVGATAAPASANTIGQGFVVTPSDLAFILQQIKIAERHARALAGTEPTAPANPNPTGDPVYCQSMIGSGPDQIGSPLLSLGLRTVDGSCNNLLPGQAKYGAADQAFPRLTTPFFKSADPVPAGFPGAGSPTSYTSTAANSLVFDAEPRMISNLIVDQTSTNPAAVAAAGFPVRTQGADPVVPCLKNSSGVDLQPLQPVGCVPQYETLFIENVTTDVGLSPPFNSLFTIFGQFFDHGLDKITNGGNGTVFVPLKADDPLVAGPDHIFGNSDDLPASQRFMVLTRGHIITGADGFRNAPNTDTPFVDQSQTYTSHASHQIFLREYVNNSAGRPVSTGKFLSTTDGDGMANWSQIKLQASTKLGLALRDVDVTNIPMIAADPYGKFIPGPLRGLPQYVTNSGLVEGNTASPVAPPANVKRIDTAFLNDIAHSADPGTLDTPKTPDSDTNTGGSLDPVATGQYDNELLDIHAICGDGRCNENIALQAVHQIFHSEHDRLIDYIKNVLITDSSGTTHLADWQAALGAPDAVNGPWNGERLFQAARFVTEMQYQHLVFEEFARKVQPAITPFQPFAFNQTDVNPAITAEFAHAVYRFGHSMLDEDIPRINANGSRNDIPLLDGFLNPASYFDGGSAGTLNSRQAATAIIMGLSDQSGNEIDEFVSETLRNNLLGLPLDLPSLNMTRARSEGIPSLNNVRKQIFAATGDGQLTPYANWIDFGQSLKHPESLVNFVAAYGTHPTILAATTIAGKREAARLIVAPDILAGDVAPSDASDFLFSMGAWENSGSDSTTGLDKVDLWVGGLAEKTNLFGGLLGSTFNYVFENQLTNLQNGDRLYYLARTPGMNLRTQLEGNSFAELVMRNTDAHTLKADPFATADCKFEIGLLTGPATTTDPDGIANSGDENFLLGTGTVNNVKATECNDNRLLLRQPNGEISYRERNTVDPAGINGQGVYNGTDAVDRIRGGNDNDTVWGGLGNDIIDGNGGDDVVLGGEGNDIITDFAGADVPKGGPGNDAINGGIGDDIIMAGEGKDFTNGGANINETFAGAGDDFAIAGQGEDAVFGDGGDDWEEGGDQPDLLIGDSSSLLFDDHTKPGNDILIGQGSDDDYDMEGGDDIGVAGPGIEKVAGAAGYDWEIGVGDPQPQDADLSLTLVGVPLPVNGVRDRYNEVEALSGWKFNDTLRGDSVIPSQVNGGGFIGCDALDADGVARINGLNTLVTPAMLTIPSGPIEAAAATNYCELTGNVWGEGNILLGGAGSDLIEGRGGDDIIDGDRYMNVRLSIRANADGTGAEIASAALNETQTSLTIAQSAMTNIPVGTGWTGSLAGKTLQQAVFAGLIDPGQIVAVREILTPAAGADVDIAQFSGPLANYVITFNGATLTVSDAAGAAVDGTDTLRNIEVLRFCNVTDPVTRTCTATQDFTVAPSAVVAPASLTFAPRLIGTTSPVQLVTVTNGGLAPLVIGAVTRTGTDATQFTTPAPVGCAGLTLASGLSCTISVAFAPTSGGAKTATLSIAHNAAGSPTLVALSGTALTPPAAVTNLTVARAGSGAIAVGWTPPAGTITSYDVQVRLLGITVRTVSVAAPSNGTTVTGLINGLTYTFAVRAVNAAGNGPLTVSAPIVPATVPGTPAAPNVAQGAAGGALTATVTWTAPANGGTAITNYVVTALQMSSAAANATVLGTTTFTVGAVTTFTFTSPSATNNNYRFTVAAVNAVGQGGTSARSANVVPR